MLILLLYTHYRNTRELTLTNLTFHNMEFLLVMYPVVINDPFSVLIHTVNGRFLGIMALQCHLLGFLSFDNCLYTLKVGYCAVFFCN